MLPKFSVGQDWNYANRVVESEARITSVRMDEEDILTLSFYFHFERSPPQSRRTAWQEDLHRPHALL